MGSEVDLSLAITVALVAAHTKFMTGAVGEECDLLEI